MPFIKRPGVSPGSVISPRVSPGSVIRPGVSPRSVVYNSFRTAIVVLPDRAPICHSEELRISYWPKKRFRVPPNDKLGNLFLKNRYSSV